MMKSRKAGRGEKKVPEDEAAAPFVAELRAKRLEWVRLRCASSAFANIFYLQPLRVDMQ
jgi:hypothetical protein